MGNDQLIHTRRWRPSPRTIAWLAAMAAAGAIVLGYWVVNHDLSPAPTSVERTSASEVDNADGSPVSGRDPTKTPQSTLSETASRPSFVSITQNAPINPTTTKSTQAVDPMASMGMGH